MCVPGLTRTRAPVRHHTEQQRLWQQSDTNLRQWRVQQDTLDDRAHYKRQEDFNKSVAQKGGQYSSLLHYKQA